MIRIGTEGSGHAVEGCGRFVALSDEPCNLLLQRSNPDKGGGKVVSAGLFNGDGCKIIVDH